MNPYEARRQRLDAAEAGMSGENPETARKRLEEEAKQRAEEAKKKQESKGYWFQRLFGG